MADDTRVKVVTRTHYAGSALENTPGPEMSRDTRYLTPTELDSYVWRMRHDAATLKVHGTVHVDGIPYLMFGPGLAMRPTVPEYRRDYQRGWKASERAAEIRESDDRNEPDAWHHGYLDYAADREKWHMPNCPDHSKCP